jgi:hypothetical protein
MGATRSSGLALLLLAACATPENKAPSIAGPAPEKAPAVVSVHSGSQPAAPAVIDENTRAVNLSIDTRAVGRMESVRQEFQVSSRAVAPSQASLRFQLADLPFTLPLERTGKDVWRLDLPPNLLQLLAKDPKTAEYSGTLVLDPWGARRVSVKLVLFASGTGRKKSAG